VNITTSTVTRFNAKVIIGLPSECWPWTGNRNSDGYGVVSYRKAENKPSKIFAHRVAVLIDGRTIPDGMQVNHTCDNRACVNPAHLYVGTQQQNIADAVARGRVQRVSGENSHRAKSTDADVRGIREQYADGKGVSELVGAFGITPAYVNHLVIGRIRREAGGPIQPKLRRGVHRDIAAKGSKVEEWAEVWERDGR
jgi:hypothetical protein